DAKAKQLLRLGVFTIWDLLTHFPVRFEDRTKVSKIFDIENGSYHCVNAIVVSPVTEHFVRKGLTYYKLLVRDDTGIATCIFFNNKYIKNNFKVGYEYSFYGKVNIRGKNKEILSPEFELSSKSECTKCIVPIYPLTSGITQKFMRNLILESYRLYHSYMRDIIPPSVLRTYSLCPLEFAIKNIHFPADLNSLEIAKKRLVFEEFFILQTTLRKMKISAEKKQGIRFTDKDITPFLSSLPFTLTNAQKKVTDEILSDLSSGTVMNRLVQGDVGSGKTVIAAISIYVCVKNGNQAAMMAPTEVLARQHYNDLSPMLENLGIKCALLTGSTSQKTKREIYEKLKSGEIDALFGTHALITEKVSFMRLALAVTDEQHRFGVRQRMALSEKGSNVHTLVMTATPIPRTLALIIYGDMDISVIGELPPGRQVIDTYCVGENMRERIYAFIRKEVEKNNRCYIVCPSVEESENIPLKSVEEHFSHLSSKIFPDIPMGLVHGKMKSADKEKAMSDFICGESKILVSTTVIEVGVNVPEATLMIIENAERFGLSQLHQLRGRVGRGSSKSYCVLFCSSFSDDIKERMQIMTKSNDGFKISEKDLTLRGPGDFFGTRQHGALHFKIADLANDLSVLKQSGTAAEALLKDDPQLLKEENFYIKEASDALSENLTL
ncbi:MAG: ATP-dependent DNA helicase RecG, partial [Clostridia bacterium]|nr:ATP-dependent DNA helicase RecG [Clostridia bacterium]